MALKTKMEPIYIQRNMNSAVLDEIKFHYEGQVLSIKAKKDQSMLETYQKLKKLISHKGFNDYFRPIKRLGKGAFATVYLI